MKSQHTSSLIIPGFDVVFLLTLKATVDLKEYVGISGLTYTGKQIKGEQTSPCVLRRTIRPATIEIVTATIGQENVLSAPWCEAFRQAYPEPDGCGNIAVPDPSFRMQGHAFILCLLDFGLEWQPAVKRASRVFDTHWRWLCRWPSSEPYPSPSHNPA